jgi:hypothetical protein
LVHENFVDGILTLNLTKDPTIRENKVNEKQDDVEQDRLDIDDDTFMRFSLTKSNIAD